MDENDGGELHVLRAIFMADFFSDPTSDARSRKTRSACYLPANRRDRFPPLSGKCTNPLFFIWLSGFARVEGKDGTGEIIPPVRPDERE